ncbi:ubiquitin-related domain-containing protein [Plectosphaerella plurivora]|uniref:Ubiquitin-related domain-containing protein n=1 Tax=Plectosphaerella plurivora TaxID=936078 RepID=A0A9P8V1G8_9PEZI|nr:ubiquitin-related domain-containing protein [Plectosphaerella plurivora]
MADSSKPTTAVVPDDVPATKESQSATAPSIDQPKDAVPMTEMPKTTATETEQQLASEPTPVDASSSKPVEAANDSTTAEETPVAAPAATSTTTTTTQDDKIEPSSGTQPPLPREDSMAIGPSVENIQSVTPGQPSDGLVCNITLLLTTGARHPYRIDERYLTKRNVNVPSKTDEGKVDPFSISVYTLKELILREWRDEWDAKPASPSSIRLIHFGKLLDDKDQLKQYHFSADAANVVHMTVRPADLIEEEEPKGGSKSGAGGRSRSSGGGCCVIL